MSKACSSRIILAWCRFSFLKKSHDRSRLLQITKKPSTLSVASSFEASSTCHYTIEQETNYYQSKTNFQSEEYSPGGEGSGAQPVNTRRPPDGKGHSVLLNLLPPSRVIHPPRLVMRDSSPVGSTTSLQLLQ